MTEDWLHLKDLIRENGMPVAGVRVLEFLDSEGEMEYGIGYEGDVPLSHLVGLLELAKLHIVEQSKEWHD